ncbi:hypothetical protein MLD38_010376 [Melastoma candidum]|uniref:Uncharacterized protein n=1 Tax=Melastoma candidum TaxID=119954 RepID=A0ACB9R2R3_9MYRT|nr:hypothetical protein MLD38_010376 [Melastoma candidum]
MATAWSPLSPLPSSRRHGWLRGTVRRSPRVAASLSPSGSQDGSPAPAAAVNPLFLAAHYTVDNFVKSGMVVGLGSGTASLMAIRYLGQRLRVGSLEDIVGVPTCFSSAREAAKAGIPLKEYEESSRIDMSFDDADMMEKETLSAVIGRRQLSSEESIIQEKMVLEAANNLVFVIPQSTYEGALEGSIPVLVQTLGWMETAEEIDDLFLGDAEVWRRPSIGHADPMGGRFPLITKEGHNVLDIIFTSPIISLAEVAESIDKINGVVDHGIVYKLPCTAVIASESGISVVDNMQQF